MLVRQGDDRHPSLDRRLACLLASVAGALNASAFQAVGFFSANMTGNVSSLSAQLARGNILLGAFFLAIVSTFIFGATLSTILINFGHRHRISGIYAYNILLEATLLALLASVALLLSPGEQGATIILGLSFLMGLQNAVVTRISNARVRTTHVSGMITDIGIELASLVEIALGYSQANQAKENRMQLGLHALTVLAFLVGGIIGILFYQAIGLCMFFISAAVLFGSAALGIRSSRRHQVVSIEHT